MARRMRVEFVSSEGGVYNGYPVLCVSMSQYAGVVVVGVLV
jgi:hypothetical protein